MRHGRNLSGNVVACLLGLQLAAPHPLRRQVPLHQTRGLDLQKKGRRRRTRQTRRRVEYCVFVQFALDHHERGSRLGRSRLGRSRLGHSHMFGSGRLRF